MLFRSPAASPYLLDLFGLARTSPISSPALGAVAVRSREVAPAHKVPAPKTNLRNAAAAFSGNVAPVIVAPRIRRRRRSISSSALTALHMFCSGMAIAAALASFVPLFQPWILAAGVIFIAGASPVLSRRRLAGGITAVGGLMALMAIGTSVGWLAIFPLLSQSQTPSPTGRRSLAPGNQPQATVVSEKVNSQVEERVKRAQALFLHAELAEALHECDGALRIDPSNGQARWLRDQISKTQEILQGKAH